MASPLAVMVRYWRNDLEGISVWLEFPQKYGN